MTNETVYHAMLEKAKLNIDHHTDSSLLYADSAIRIVRLSHIGDTALINLYAIKARSYQSMQKSDSVNVYLDLMQRVATANNDSLAMAEGYLLKGELEADNENVFVAEKYLLKSIPILARKGADVDLAQAYSLYGTMLSGRVEYKSAQTQFLKAYEIYKLLDWAKQEFVGEWRWQLVEISSERRPGRYIFYFESERDYLAFLLKCS